MSSPERPATSSPPPPPSRSAAASTARPRSSRPHSRPRHRPILNRWPSGAGAVRARRSPADGMDRRSEEHSRLRASAISGSCRVRSHPPETRRSWSASTRAEPSLGRSGTGPHGPRSPRSARRRRPTGGVSTSPTSPSVATPSSCTPTARPSTTGCGTARRGAPKPPSPSRQAGRRARCSLPPIPSPTRWS